MSMLSATTEDRSKDVGDDVKDASSHESGAMDYDVPNFDDGEEEEWNSDEYDFVHQEELNEKGEREFLITEHFQGTWNGAYHETSKAINEVSRASRTYCDAIAQSGIAKAGRSIGGALAKTVDHGALTTASFALAASGTDQDRLPRGVRKWLKRKEEIDQAKMRAEEAEMARVARKYKAQLIASGEVTEVLPVLRSQSRKGSHFSLDTSGDHFRDDRIARRLIPARAHTDSQQIRNNVDKIRIGRNANNDQSTAKIMPRSDKNPWLPTGTQYSPVTPYSLTTHFEELPKLKTPAHAPGIFKDLETPEPVRHMLSKPLAVGECSPLPLFRDANEESPYGEHSDDETCSGSSS